jgi:preprotein translocase subunit SecA
MSVMSASARLFAKRPDWSQRVSRLRGSAVIHDLRRFDAPLAAVTAFEPSCRALPDEALLERALVLRARARAGAPRADLAALVFALAREAARRALGERPFDEQVVAGLALAEGHVVEMQTGEGKTLAAVAPAALEALAGHGVHVLTFNDYLARRDAEWMAPVYRRLGLTVGFVQHGLSPAERRTAYGADLTYVTAKEAGFDHLRDLLARDQEALVHRPFRAAIVDEADSLMIDEARVPLVIAGRVDGHASQAARLAALVRSLTPGVHYGCDEYRRDVELTDAGIERAERLLGCAGLHDSAEAALLTELNCALHAHVLLRRDVDYLVRDQKVEIIDEFTGRVVPDRHWPDGLQAALDAKEGLVPRDGGRILGSMTVQRFLRGYPRLCGMTGTAQDAAAELAEFYGLAVAVIPTHREMKRVDRVDVLFTHRDAKDRAVLAEVRRVHATGRPVLVGTTSVTESERLAIALAESGVACEVLNARNDTEEARVVARAGTYGAVTISTNMAGRGTDIRLGGPLGEDCDRVAALGGLYVIGTARHESRRVDRQLRGRAGRQGDPGESGFFISLEDDLLVRYGITDLIPARFLPARTEAPIDHPVVRREVARAQRIVEGQNFEIRRTLARYSAVLEHQHRIFAGRRWDVLTGAEVSRVWQDEPVLRAALVASAGEAAVVRAERIVTLACLDRAWRDHLAVCADVREGIHLVRLGGADPLAAFAREAIRSFSHTDEAVDDDVLAALPAVKIVDGDVVLTGAGLEAPAATWTYLVNDDPFKNRIGALLTGPGGATVAIYAAVMLTPLLLAWGLLERLKGRLRTARTTPPAAGRNST